MKTLTAKEAAVEFDKGKIIQYVTKTGEVAVLETLKLGRPEGHPEFGFVYKNRAAEPKFLDTAPEASIRRAIAYVGQRELQILEPVAMIVGDPLPVPLGPNRTRDGRQARVVCNDSTEKPGFPVVAVIVNSGGGAFASLYTAEGRPCTGSTASAGLNLVGHLPPEPPAPRELYALLNFEGVPVGVKLKTDDPHYTLFREVQP